MPTISRLRKEIGTFKLRAEVVVGVEFFRPQGRCLDASLATRRCDISDARSAAPQANCASCSCELRFMCIGLHVNCAPCVLDFT